MCIVIPIFALKILFRLVTGIHMRNMAGNRPYPPDFDERHCSIGVVLHKRNAGRTHGTYPRHQRLREFPMSQPRSMLLPTEENMKTFPEECKTETVTRSNAFEMSRKDPNSYQRCLLSSNVCDANKYGRCAHD
jgi:hypothetical protein